MAAIGLLTGVWMASAALAQAAAESAIAEAVQALATQGVSGEVLVAREGRTVYARAFSAPGRKHPKGARWRWASVSKQITAILTLQEVAAGRLSLTDTVAERLPAFAGTTAGQISLRMLLQHTSGLPNPSDTPLGASGVPVFYLAKGLAGDPRNTALGFCAGPASPPSNPMRFSYNNCDTLVLQAVLERSSGQSFERLIAKRIAEPLGRDDVGVFPTDPDQAPRTVHGRREDGTPEPWVNLGTYGASGGLYGPPEALLALDVALLEGRLLPPAQRAELWKGDPELGYVALGAWSFEAPLKGCAKAVKLVERRGEIGGVEVRNVLAPERQGALVVFVDRAGLDFGEVWQGRGLTHDLASAAFCAD